MTEKRKRKINAFDVCLIVLFMLVLAAGWFILFRGGGETIVTDLEGDTAIFFVEVTALTPEEKGQIEVGDWVRDGVRLFPIGYVRDITYLPHEMRIGNPETGEIYFEEVPGQYVMIVSIEANIRVTDRDILAEGQFPIKGGAPIHFVGPGFAFSNGIILGIQRGGGLR